uniref:Superkiller viralicidic activity 2-like 2 n=1 Tax=Cacopsylla melanoneura TaxID=428564 RepID=A0A8D9EIG9_9HEMI
MADLDDLFSVFDEDQDSITDKPSDGPSSEDPVAVPQCDIKIKEEKIEEDDTKTTKGKRSLVSEDISTDVTMKKIKKEDEDEIMKLTESKTKACMKVIVVETLEACLHEVALPPDIEYTPLVQSTGKPAREYPFVLDPFQKEAILCIENNQSVLVSAHTSAGKTVVAEYAIAASLQQSQRVIYTTPIKALSNQKYREFEESFKDVGLITGDVTINPSSSCLIMTTEILRNMLYRGSEITREVGWVIFDEIHYMRDKERGYVWEETLILLSDNVRLVFLSATIPNASQFAQWVSHLHHQPCHVVYTDYRPTPLQHYLFPNGGDGIHLIVDDNKFKEHNYQVAMNVLANAGDAAKAGDHKGGRRGGPRGGGSEQTNCFKIVKMIMERNLAPVIVFSFSKKDCEIYAMQMAKLNFNETEEVKLVDDVFSNAMDVLSEEDRKLPQIENILPLLRRGIGIHHGGLLPILKETIEILFAEGLIKVLFATETFAMGLNMPARTVLFTSSRKFDGKEERFLTSGEYIQMSGRAGRRGLDDKGIVILMIDEKVSADGVKNVVQGPPDPLNSAFHLTYNMVLNLLRVEEINPEYMLERSFYQFQNQSTIPDLAGNVKSSPSPSGRSGPLSVWWTPELEKEKKDVNDARKSFQRAKKPAERETLKTIYRKKAHTFRKLLGEAKWKSFHEQSRVLCGENLHVLIESHFRDPKIMYRLAIKKSQEVRELQGRVHKMKIEREAEVASYYHIRQQLDLLAKEYQSFINNPQYLIPFLQGGRLVKIKNDEHEFEWGMVVNFKKRNPREEKTRNPVKEAPSLVVDVLLCLHKDSTEGKMIPGNIDESGNYVMEVTPVPNKFLSNLSAVRINYPKDLRSLDSRMTVLKTIKEVLKRFPDGPQLLNPTKDMGIRESAFAEIVKKIEFFEKSLFEHPLNESPELEQLYNQYSEKVVIVTELNTQKKELQTAMSLLHMEELKCRKRVLRRLGYATDADVIEMKGRVACELSNGDELLMTELIFNGVFNDLTVAQCCALLSCFVCDEKSSETPAQVQIMAGPLRKMQELARHIARISIESKLDLDEDSYVNQFKPSLMDVVHEWCEGASFLKVCSITDIFEGSIIRCMRRLEEVLRQLVQASRNIGNTLLEDKFNEAIKTVKRDIVFAASLYL